MKLEILSSYEFIRQNIQYILVYNSAKHGKLAYSDSRNATYNYIMERAQVEEKLFDIDKLQDFLFKETHTYSKEQFEQKFVLPMEKQEEAATS